MTPAFPPIQCNTPLPLSPLLPHPPLHFKICSYRPESLRRFCYRGIVTFATWEFSLNKPRSLFAIPANHIYPLSSPFPFDSFFPIPKFLFCGFLHFRDSFFTEARNLVSFTSFFFLGPFRLPQVLPRLFVIWWIWRNRKKKVFVLLSTLSTQKILFSERKYDTWHKIHCLHASTTLYKLEIKPIYLLSHLAAAILQWGLRFSNPGLKCFNLSYPWRLRTKFDFLSKTHAISQISNEKIKSFFL